jgi:hypothetical protein
MAATNSRTEIKIQSSAISATSNNTFKILSTATHEPIVRPRSNIHLRSSGSRLHKYPTMPAAIFPAEMSSHSWHRTARWSFRSQSCGTIYQGTLHLTCFPCERAPQASGQLYPTVPTNAPSQQRHATPQQYFVLCAIVDYT